MSANYEGPRNAPGPESPESMRPLDAVVVVPIKGEKVEDVINMLQSISSQRKQKGEAFVHGAVLVVNSRPDAEREDTRRNMQVYALVQGIRYGCQLKIDGRTDLTQKIREIQDSKLRIELIDAFSDQHSHEKTNVGMARRFGTEMAVQHAASDKTPILSTDADTLVGNETLATLRQIFETEEVDIMPLHSDQTLQGMDEASLRAARLHNLYWRVKNIIGVLPAKIKAMEKASYFPENEPTSQIRDSAIWLGGASTAFTVGAYKRSPGYRDIGRAEDGFLASDIVRTGGHLRDLRAKYPAIKVFTQPRISTRTELGWGHTIAAFEV